MKRSLQAGLGRLFAGDALDQITQAAFGADADDILRGWWQLQLKF